MIKNFFKRFYLVLICVILYAPIITLMVLSFNSSKSRSKWGGFTTKWYVELFKNNSIMNALYTTLIIALLSALIATILGTAAAIGIQAMRKKMRTVVTGVTNIPMLNADIVTGISLMLLFIACRFSLGFKTILIAHITFNIPYVILSVLPKLRQTNVSTYEAALDLGASPLYAFFKVVFPDILPGVSSGFLLAFTMSLDDFIITHFTKGPGVDTLSTKIYSEVRKGINPSMYALSTLMFLVVMILLLLINMNPDEKAAGAKNAKISKVASQHPKLRKFRKVMMSRVVPVCMVVLILAGGIFYGIRSKSSSDKQVIVYNWGEYIDPETLDMFEEETGINVVYEEYETNEIMYPKIQSGAIAYDVVCPSDYMIQKMRENDLLAELNFDNIPNIAQIDPAYMEMSQAFDPENKYSVPYCWGTVGILYNTRLLDELGVPAPTKWANLWDERLSGEILMQDSVRDAFMVALKKDGYSMNSESKDELEQAKQELIDQKPLVQAYVIDQVRDKMIGGEAAVGVIYSGEMLYIQDEVASLGLDYDLEYVIPEEGTNLWLDSWVIPKNAKNKENAEKWIDFMCRPEIAKANFEYITYPTPNKGAFELLDEDMQNNKAVFPDIDFLKDSEVYQYLGDDTDAIYNELWKEVKAN